MSTRAAFARHLRNLPAGALDEMLARLAEGVDERCQATPAPATLADTMAAQITKKNPRGAGRAPRAGKAATNKVTIRLTDTESKAFMAAAKVAGRGLAVWIRETCTAALPRKKGK